MICDVQQRGEIDESEDMATQRRKTWSLWINLGFDDVCKDRRGL